MTENAQLFLMLLVSLSKQLHLIHLPSTSCIPGVGQIYGTINTILYLYISVNDIKIFILFYRKYLFMNLACHQKLSYSENVSLPFNCVLWTVIYLFIYHALYIILLKCILCKLSCTV